MRKILPVILAITMLFFVAPGTAIAQTTCGEIYTVQIGDTMSGIAQKCNVNYTSLLAANPNMTNYDLIFPGDQVNIPQGGIPITGGQVYTVKTGDTLYSIAQDNNVLISNLLVANPTLTNPDLIYPGQTIILPTSADNSPGIPNTGGNGNTYTVQYGDTLSGIANRYNITTTALWQANSWITNPDYILPGWVLTLPSGASQ